MPITTVKEFGEAILEGVRAPIDDLPKPALVAWFGLNASLLYIEINKPNPLDRFSVVIAIFHDEEALRIYTLPAALPQGVSGSGGKFVDGNGNPVDWRIRAPSRSILSRIAPTYVTEAFPNLDVMADAIIDEWNMLADGISSADAELEAVIEYLETFPKGGVSVEHILDDLRAGAHHIDEDDEDDGDDSPTTTPNQEPASPPAPVAVSAPAPEAPKPA
jgi:hypothetical protein